MRVLQPNTTAAAAFSSGLSIVTASFPFGKPHTLLQLIGVDVGDDREAQISAALALSAAMFVVVSSVVVLVLLLVSCWIKSRGEDHFGARQDARTTIWTVHNRRYDLTAFVEKHPGGAFAINLGRGRSCTELFESYHSLADEERVRACLEEYYVEDTPSGAPDFDDTFDWRRTPFFNALKRAVRGHFSRVARPGPSWRTRNHCATVQQCAQLLGFVLATAVALCGFLRADLLALLLLPFCYWSGPSSCMHDGGHMSLSRRPWANSALAHLGSFHMSPFSWAHQHTIGHHAHTNIAGKDPDLYHFVLDNIPGFRTSLELRNLPERDESFALEAFRGNRSRRYRLGLCLRMPFTTCGPSILWDVQSLADPLLQFAFMGLVPYLPLTTISITSHLLGRTLVVWLAFFHPAIVCLLTARGWGSGVAWALLYALWPFAVHGYVFYLFSQVSHVQDSCQTHAATSDHAVASQCHAASQHASVELPASQHTDVEHAPLASTVADATADESAVLMLAEDNSSHASVASPPKFAEAQDDSSRAGVSGGASRRSIADADVEAEGAGKKGDAHKGEWAAHQIEHTLDYAVDSPLWLHLSNGLNLQVVHHLFPQVGWGHYPALQPIVRAVCDEYGVSYTTAPSFWAALRSHFAHLARINAGFHASVWIRPPGDHAPRRVLLKLHQLDE